MISTHVTEEKTDVMAFVYVPAPEEAERDTRGQVR